MNIIKTKKFILRPFSLKDAPALAKNINDKITSRNAETIPYPYTLKDARNWLKKISRNDKLIDFAIDINGEVIGAIGILLITNHKAEIDYWLARRFWGQGIITCALKEVTRFGFDKLKLKRIFAYVYSFNRPSMRVLEKNHYRLEGILRRDVKKGKKFYDTYLFAKVRS